MSIAYHLRDDATVEQQDDDGVWRVHTLVDKGPFGDEKSLFDNKVARWWPLALQAELDTGVFAPVTMAVIYSESGGTPDRPTSSDGGVGLMAITSSDLKKGFTDDQLRDPATNIGVGTRYLRTLVGKIGSYDPVQLASMYNCGSGPHGPHVRPDLPWGYCEYVIPQTGATPYISKVVRAYNYAIQTYGASRPLGGWKKVALGLGVLGVSAFAGVVAADPDLLGRLRRMFA